MRDAQSWVIDITEDGIVAIFDNRRARTDLRVARYKREVPDGGWPFVVQVADDADFGDGTAKFVVAYKNTVPEAGDWKDMTDQSGTTFTLAAGNSYRIQHTAQWIGVELEGATEPALSMTVSY